MIKWAELIPTMCGWSIVLDDNCEPVFYDSKAEVLEEISEMNKWYQDEIEAGERDKDDEWEGEAHRVWFNDNEQLFLVDENDEPIEEIDWRAQL